MKVIDSHIHILALKNQEILYWKGDHPLNKQCRLEEYTAQNESEEVDIEGVIAIEFLPITDLNQGIDGCQNAIEEYLYFSRIINGTLSPDEGSNQYSKMIKAVVPWVPMPLGPEVVEQFVNKMKLSANTFDYVKGFRYLLQALPQKTMLQPKFIDSLKWVEENGYIFDWGIDLNSTGLWQFEESVELFKQVPNVKYIINHLTKPTYGRTGEFELWKKYMTQMYELTPNSYMKLSGGFSEVPIELVEDLDECTKLIYPWFKVCFDLWGVDRTMWASNWPVCAVPGGPNVAVKWVQITEKLFDMINLPQADRHKIYYENYKAGYNLD